MRFGNPRQAIHDAYLSIRSKELGGSGTAGVDSSARAFQQVKAGLVIKAVESLPDQYRILLQYCYAPDGICKTSDAHVLYIHVLKEMLEKSRAKKQLSERKIAEMAVMVTKVMQNFQNAVLGGRDQVSRQEVTRSLDRTNFTGSLVSQWEQVESILYSYLERGMAPIETLCTKQVEMIKDGRLESLKARMAELNISEQGCVSYVNQANGTTHVRLNTFTHFDADVLENQMDRVKESRNIKILGDVKTA